MSYIALFINAFEPVAATIGTGILGFWIISRKVVPGKALGTLTPLATDIALPCLIFVTITYEVSPYHYTSLLTIPLWWVGYTALMLMLSLGAVFIFEKNYPREFSASLFYQNAVFFPISIINGIFGYNSDYLLYLLIFTMFYPGFFFCTFPAFFKGDIKRFRLKRFINAPLIATITAVLVRTTGTGEYIPDFIISMLTGIGAITVPILLFIIGGNLYTDFQEKGKLHIWEIVKFVTIKNIIFPMIVLSFIVLVRPVKEIAFILLIQSAVPPIVAVPVMVERNGGDRAIVNQFIVAGFLFSLISIPLFVTFFDTIY